EATVARIEIFSVPALHEVGDTIGRQLHDEAALDEHREHLSLQLERTRAKLLRSGPLLLRPERLCDRCEAPVTCERCHHAVEFFGWRHALFCPVPPARRAAVS